jgi:hypothetical protein
MKKYLISAFLIFPSLVFSAPDIVTKNFSSDGVLSLDFRNMSGDATIMAAEGNVLSVEATKKVFHKNCYMKIKKKGKKLFVQVKKTRLSWWGVKCYVDFKITLPKTSKMDLRSGAGDISIKDISGALDVKLGSGDLNAILNESTQFAANLGSGNIDVTGLIGSANIKIGSGNISLSWNHIPDEGSVNIKAGSGDIELIMPANSQVRTTYKTGAGSFVNELGNFPHSKFRVFAMMGAGDFAIKK